METDAVVPAIWPLEIANVLLVGERRGRLTQTQAIQFLALLTELRILVEGETKLRAWRNVLSVGRTFGLTAYDAAYLELAMRKGLPLAAQDQQLRTAARAAGVSVPE